MRSQKHLNIGIIGSYNHPNFGDQYLFKILYEWIREYDRSVFMTIPWADRRRIQWPGEQVKVGGGWSSLLSSDLVIFAGGGYLGEPGQGVPYDKSKPEYLSRLERKFIFRHLPGFLGGEFFRENRHLRRPTLKFIKYSTIARLAKMFRIPYIILGVGLGPVSTCIGRHAIGYLLKGAQKVSLRDKESVSYAKEICPDVEIFDSADMVLSKCEKIRSSRQLKNVGIHLGTRVEELIDISLLAKEIEKLILQKEVCVKFVTDGISLGDIATDPVRIPAKINNTLGQKLEIVHYRGVDDFLNTLRQFDILLSTKLHGGIVAYTMGVFPISIAAHIKTERFYRQVDLEDYALPLSNDGVKRGFTLLSTVLGEPDKVNKLLERKRYEIIEKAMLNKKILYSFLDGIRKPRLAGDS